MPVLQSLIPYDPFSPRPLPGVQPLDPSEWLITDDAYSGQMAERDRLLRDHRDQVLAMDPSAMPAARELLDLVLGELGESTATYLERADGVRVAVNRSDPLGTLGRLVQEDLCILEKRGDEHVLTGAVLCFPASWSLDEKFLRPLIGIHHPVEPYDNRVAVRVQRLFDGLQVGRPLWRHNMLWYADAKLHQPRKEAERRPKPEPGKGGFLRSERQCLLRLPQTRAVIFSIHTYVLERASLEVPEGQ